MKKGEKEGRKAGGGGRINKVYKEDGKGKKGIMKGVKLMGKGTKGQTEKDRERKEGRKEGKKKHCLQCLKSLILLNLMNKLKM